MKIATAYKYESPSYEINTEDGPGSDWCYLIGADDADGNQYTLTGVSFERFDDDVDKLVDRILNAMEIDESKWHQGNAWDHYKVVQTWEEEKADYYAAN